MNESIPGRLVNDCRLQPLKRISPSRFVGIQECALREVWRAAACPPLLPRPPRAWVGTIIHEILQMIPTGRFNSRSKPEIGEAWDFKVAETEKSMLLSWLDAPSVPLKNSAWDFEVQKIRTINRVFAMAWSDDYKGGQGGPFVSSSELWVETADHFVGGFIDSVEETNQELILRDFKSGLINVYGSDSTEVKPEYVAQLELYCAIFFESRGRWADALQIVPVAGDPVTIPVDRTKCLALLQSAKDTLHRINSVIESTSDVKAGFLELASVTPNGCTRCEFRPGCPAYKCKAASDSDEKWPQDVTGQVAEIASFPNGSTAITAKTQLGLTRVRGLASVPGRHPALPFLSASSWVGLYNLKSVRDNTELVQGPLTTIYDETPFEPNSASAITQKRP